VDEMNDPNNCNGCAHVCPAVANSPAGCASGSCTDPCNAGYTACGAACVDFQTSNGNCGGCGAGYACATGNTCVNGMCKACTSVELPPSVNVNVSTWAAEFKTSPTWNCSAAGTMTISSTTGVVTDTTCALGTPEVITGVTQTGGGPAVTVILLQGLTVTGGHVVNISGASPVVFLVAGNVTVDTGGIISADANGATPGAGGNGSACGASTGTASSSTSTGGGGGGFGTAGGYGAKPSGSSGSAGGVVATSLTLQPLTGGCGGGAGGSFLAVAASPAGAGGGGFEISASGTITVGHTGDTATTTGTLTAAGGGSPAATGGQNVGSGGGGSGGGILLVSPVAATFNGNGAARAHGGGSGAGEGIAGTTGVGGAGQNGHDTNNTAASGGTKGTDCNSAAGAAGGLCAGAGCATASATGIQGNESSPCGGVTGSGGGGGGGSIQVTTGAAVLVCN
jgi:hypothetical protein